MNRPNGSVKSNFAFFFSFFFCFSYSHRYSELSLCAVMWRGFINATGIRHQYGGAGIALMSIIGGGGGGEEGMSNSYGGQYNKYGAIISNVFSMLGLLSWET